MAGFDISMGLCYDSIIVYILNVTVLVRRQDDRR
jgi:hypothetical protein